MRSNELKLEAANNGWTVTTKDEFLIFDQASDARKFIDNWQFDLRQKETENSA